ncbi:Hypothetical protein NTJ_04957 [Nesidiocoris tenuis]|uniref:Uncharacterized protein n=2 Tax=Nesidiocoris tenuis TaxID=355587 RepID=A0ABN7AIQ7_9HEMI|nr:Hypothetical protein NTJ_04957 [Nesidiocoris tenuis]
MVLSETRLVPTVTAAALVSYQLSNPWRRIMKSALRRCGGVRRPNSGGMSPHDSQAMGAMSPEDMALFGMVWLLGLKAELRRLEAAEEAAKRSPGIFTVEPPPPSPYCRVHGYKMRRHPPNKGNFFIPASGGGGARVTLRYLR